MNLMFLLFFAKRIAVSTKPDTQNVVATLPHFSQVRSNISFFFKKRLCRGQMVTEVPIREIGESRDLTVVKSVPSASWLLLHNDTSRGHVIITTQLLCSNYVWSLCSHISRKLKIPTSFTSSGRNERENDKVENKKEGKCGRLRSHIFRKNSRSCLRLPSSRSLVNNNMVVANASTSLEKLEILIKLNMKVEQ